MPTDDAKEQKEQDGDVGDDEKAKGSEEDPTKPMEEEEEVGEETKPSEVDPAAADSDVYQQQMEQHYGYHPSQHPYGGYPPPYGGYYAPPPPHGYAPPSGPPPPHGYAPPSGYHSYQYGGPPPPPPGAYPPPGAGANDHDRGMSMPPEGYYPPPSRGPPSYGYAPPGAYPPQYSQPPYSSSSPVKSPGGSTNNTSGYPAFFPPTPSNYNIHHPQHHDDGPSPKKDGIEEDATMNIPTENADGDDAIADDDNGDVVVGAKSGVIEIVPATSATTTATTTTTSPTTNDHIKKVRNLKVYVKPTPKNIPQDVRDRRERKNANSRARAAKHRIIVEELESKPEHERTLEEQQLIDTHYKRRSHKNTRSRDRALEKKAEIERILSKPDQRRAKLEKQFLDNALTSKSRKNEG